MSIFKKKNTGSAVESYYNASQFTLMKNKFKKHKLAMVGLVILIILYLGGIFCEFVAPIRVDTRDSKLVYAPPQKIHWVHEGKFIGPFFYDWKTSRNMETFELEFEEDRANPHRLGLFVKGEDVKLWGFIPLSRHLFGAVGGESHFHLCGTDSLGRDIFSRCIYGSRISLSVGFIGMFMTFIIGLSIGGAAGYFGGLTDNIIQRVIEFIKSVPTLPLWMAFAAILPPDWSPLAIYFGITIILSLIGWTDLARVVRSRLLSLKDEDFVLAAKVSAVPTAKIIGKHMIPSFLSYIIVSLTLSIPNIILGETAMSFVGLGLRPPIVSWGVLLNEASDIHAIAVAPWLMLPILFIFFTIIAFNFVGDGLRDAADPYTR